MGFVTDGCSNVIEPLPLLAIVTVCAAGCAYGISTEPNGSSSDAVIEGDPIFSGRICDHESCKACANICPSNAISVEKSVEVEICGKKMTLADINYNLCRMCQNGAAPDFTYQTGSEEILVDMVGNQPSINEVSTVLSKKSIPNIQMALCNRTCIHHLQEKKKLDRSHVNPFRNEDPWKLDIWEKGAK